MTVPERTFPHDEHDHGHEHDHDHGPGAHEHDAAQMGGKGDLLIALAITILMMIAEVVGGLLSNSLALLSDAGHMLTDNLALLLSFFAMKFAAMPATERRTFGFYRLEILAALVNGIILVLVSLYIIYEAYLRMMRPERVEGGLMLVIAVIGLVANVVGAFFLHKHSHANLNIRGAYLHIVGDALSSVGVVIGGVVILLTDWYLIDPILSLVISLVIIYGAWALVKESVSILLESTPSHINVAAIAEEIGRVQGVREAYHIHVWTITSGVYAMSGHVVIDDRLVSDSRKLLDEIRTLLTRNHRIEHSTIQLECERCETLGICELPRNDQRGGKDAGAYRGEGP